MRLAKPNVKITNWRWAIIFALITLAFWAMLAGLGVYFQQINTFLAAAINQVCMWVAVIIFIQTGSLKPNDRS